jgi:hypothetical protein
MTKPRFAHKVRRDFAYRTSVDTDLHATFARVRREQAAKQANSEAAAPAAEQRNAVLPLRRSKP